ncbi:hypothetical protein ACFWWM_12750 [Streptomyces sp. NPDC058682]|uniref:hypothetical protein n=1 Tax=unclassified Streptomyces TaxID=2593676 RepID=UPI00225878C7|nr:hypothetical protein [Streptomyces sp. NBC_01214]MCX4807773.1 hypothetical protein [Streptomyces sp. NBC_01214]
MSVYSVRAGSRPSGTGARTRSARPARMLAYAAAGAAVGGVWAFGGDMPAWEHALRVLVVVLCVSVAGRLVGRRLARAGRTPVDRSLFFGLVAAKMLLVAVALLVDWLAGMWFSEPTLITAGFLFALVAVGGPALHDWLSHGTGGRGGPGPRGIRRGGTPAGDAAA